MIKTLPDDRIITIRSTRDGHEALQVSVKDNGYGIEKENLDRIFIPFFTTKAERSRTRTRGHPFDYQR